MNFSNLTEPVITVASLVVAVALVALLVSPKARTGNVIQSAASGFGNILGVAVSPVTGNQVGINLGYPGSFGGFPVLN